MKLHVKHLKSNKKSIFFPTIIFLIPFLEKKREEKGKKKEESFLVIKTSVFLIGTQCLHHFSTLSPYCPPTLLRSHSSPGGHEDSYYQAGLGLPAMYKGREKSTDNS